MPKSVFSIFISPCHPLSLRLLLLKRKLHYKGRKEHQTNLAWQPCLYVKLLSEYKGRLKIQKVACDKRMLPFSMSLPFVGENWEGIVGAFFFFLFLEKSCQLQKSKGTNHRRTLGAILLVVRHSSEGSGHGFNKVCELTCVDPLALSFWEVGTCLGCPRSSRVYGHASPWWSLGQEVKREWLKQPCMLYVQPLQWFKQMCFISLLRRVITLQLFLLSEWKIIHALTEIFWGCPMS